MLFDVIKEQIDIQELSNSLLMVTYYPKNRFSKRNSYYCIFEPGTRYYQMVRNVDNEPDNWVMLNYLAMWCEEYHGQVINSI